MSRDLLDSKASILPDKPLSQPFNMIGAVVQKESVSSVLR